MRRWFHFTSHRSFRRFLLVVGLVTFGVSLSAGAVRAAAGPVRVPQDARTLEAAISRVADGGVIELAAGTYSPAGQTFTLSNLRKGFTVRAAAGAQVALDG